MIDDHYPKFNADGLEVVKMTDAQKHLFDLKGWIALDGLLEQSELKEIHEHQMNFLYDREKLPIEHRDNHGGPSQRLLDHPVVVGILNEILSHQALPVPTVMVSGLTIPILVTVRRVMTILVPMAGEVFLIFEVTLIFIRCNQTKFILG